MMIRSRLYQFLIEENAAVSIEWVVISAGVISLCVGA